MCSYQPATPAEAESAVGLFVSCFHDSMLLIKSIHMHLKRVPF